MSSPIARAGRREQAPAAFDHSGTRALLELLRDGRARTRADVARELHVPRSTASARLEALTATGLVGPGRDAASTGGRPPSTFVFNPGARTALTAHISRAHVRLALTDLNGRALSIHSVTPRSDQSPDEVLTAVLTDASTMMAALGLQNKELAGIGIGIGTPVDDTGRPVGSLAFPAWSGFDITGFISGFTTAPVVVEHDVNLIAECERSSHWPRHTDFLYVHLRCCPHAAIFSGGRLQKGSAGVAGILRPISEHPEDPELCACGSGVPRRFAAPPADPASARQEGRRLGEVLTVAVNLLNPSALVVGGSGNTAGAHLLAGLREAIFHQSAPAATQGLTISLAESGDTAVFSGISRLLTPRILAREVLAAASMRA